MKINLVSCFFILDSEKNDNIRKNDIKKIKILVTNNNSLLETSFNGSDMKSEVRKNLATVIGSNLFHLEQVFAIDYKNEIDIVYLGITNIENVVTLRKDFQLIDFKVQNNNTIIFGNKVYKYRTVELETNNNIEYIHEIETNNERVKRNLLNLLVSYKKIRSNADNTDILFKFMGSSFTLEDVRLLYKIIQDSNVDKSNFRKKIIKYCEKIDEKLEAQNGFRPSQKYRFKPLKGDIWI